MSLTKNLRRFKIRKYGVIFLFILLMFCNTVTLMQSFHGELFFILNSILCIVRFILYAQLLSFRLRGSGPYAKLLLAMIVIEIISFFPQLLLDFEILTLSKEIIYYMLLDAFSEVLVVFLLIDEYVYVQSLTEDISAYQKMLKDDK